MCTKRTQLILTIIAFYLAVPAGAVNNDTGPSSYNNYKIRDFDSLSHLYSDGESNLINSAVLQTKNEPEDTLFLFLDEVVIEAFNRRQNLVQVPGALTSLGNLVLERENPGLNILPTLQYAPGVFAQQGAANTSRVVIRGTGARVPYATGKIRAYFNNIPLTNASGFTFIDDIDPSVIESMEIIKGPAPSVYGAGLGGTIILNARNPEARKTGIRNSTQLGAYGLFRNATTVDFVESGFATSLTYSHSQIEGYRENNELRRDVITSVTQFNALSGTDFVTLFAYSDLKSHIPSSIDSTTYMQNPTSAAANWLGTRGYEDGRRLLGGISASRNFSPLFTTHLSIFGLWHDEKEMRPFDVFYEERYTLGTRFRAEYRRFLGIEGMLFSAGGESFLENYIYSNHQNIGGEGIQGDPRTDNREEVVSYNFFAQADGDFGALNVSAGINFNFTQRDYRDLFNTGVLNQSGIYDYGLMISPRIALGYTYLPLNAAYISFSHGFAPPSLDETLTPEGFINPDILPEKSWNLELGFRGKLWNERFFYDLSLYRMLVQDLLVAQRVAEDAWVGRNAGQSLHRGLEAEIHWVVLRQNYLEGRHFNELSFRSNLAINNFRFTDFEDRGNDYSGNKIPGVPDLVYFTSLYIESNPGVYLMPSWRFVGPMTMNDANTRFTDSYSTLDVTAGYKSSFFNRLNVDIFVRANNLLNEKYASMILVNAPSFGNAAPRYYYPGLPMHFNFGLRLGV